MRNKIEIKEKKGPDPKHSKTFFPTELFLWAVIQNAVEKSCWLCQGNQVDVNFQAGHQKYVIPIALCTL